MLLIGINRIKLLMVGLLVSLCLIACDFQSDLIGPQQNATDSLFSAAIDMGPLENSQINEASGLAASQVNKTLLWTHNDSGDDARIFLAGPDGSHKGTYYLKDADFIDAEDIAVGPGPAGESYVFVGDIGDNQAIRDVKQIYFFPEPVFDPDQIGEHVVENYEVINYRYPDGPRDAETLMIDPNTGEIFIVTKREAKVRLYSLQPSTINSGDTVDLNFVTDLPLRGIVAGDISNSGSEILLKDYQKIYYWKRNPDEGLSSILNKKPTELPYEVEPQGESITWTHDGSGYFTVSEKVAIFPATLYFYQRK